jgi:hypothetical protein
MTSFLRRHRVFLVIAVAGLVVRVIALLAYHPALWFSDSLSYSAVGVNPYPTVIRPAGYPLLLLWPLHWFHSFLLVITVQHVLGLSAGVVIYALLLRRHSQHWAAALASAPVLLSAYEIQIEHFILSDSLYIFLLVAAIAALLWNPSPGWLGCAVVGLLLAAAAITRTEGEVLITAPVLWLLMRPNATWRERTAKVALACSAFALPVASYAVWFHHYHGQYRLTFSSGPFLAARAESIVNCRADEIPLADRQLCTTPGRTPAWYLWTPNEPLHGEFTNASDKLGSSFALHVFEAQPADYLITTWEGVLQNFASGGSPYSDGQAAFEFPDRVPPRITQLAAANPGNLIAPIYRYDPSPSTQMDQPWVYILRVYQQIVVVPPIAVALIALAGLAGLVLGRERRGGPGLLPWLIGAILLIFPAATSGFGARYELAAIAPFCLAGVLALAEITGDPTLSKDPRGRGAIDPIPAQEMIVRMHQDAAGTRHPT